MTINASIPISIPYWTPKLLYNVGLNLVFHLYFQNGRACHHSEIVQKCRWKSSESNSEPHTGYNRELWPISLEKSPCRSIELVFRKGEKQAPLSSSPNQTNFRWSSHNLNQCAMCRVWEAVAYPAHYLIIHVSSRHLPSPHFLGIHSTQKSLLLETLHHTILLSKRRPKGGGRRSC